MPSNFDEKNAIVFWGQYPGNFETKFFPLRFEGILYNSVVISFMFMKIEWYWKCLLILNHFYTFLQIKKKKENHKKCKRYYQVSVVMITINDTFAVQSERAPETDSTQERAECMKI